jgi:hypothetical protein
MKDTDGNGPLWNPGNKVWVGHLRLRATVVQQILSHSEDESYWGDVIVRYENGLTGVEKSWQIMKVNE